MGILIVLLISIPFGIALLQALIKNNTLRKLITYTGSGLVILTALIFAVTWFVGDGVVTVDRMPHTVSYAMLAFEFALLGLIVFLSIKHKKYYAIILSALQTLAVAWLELVGMRYMPEGAHHVSYLYIDRLTVLMCLIVAVVGGLICIYAQGYMQDYHHHHTDVKDRHSFFFAMLYVFLGAMFGLVLSSNLIWIYFFWEITSVVSFLLIGYTKTEEAINNSFRALWMNLLGGLAFAGAILYSVLRLGVEDLQTLTAQENGMAVLPVLLLAFAGLTKSAQLPFSKWLLGAMVAPTPTSALLHSATMVKAGVYLLLRLSPAMTGNAAGIMVQLVGGITFLVASMFAITESDGKKVLAWSTVSNLGLITACAGVGTAETVWSGVILLIYHAISKALLFQTVGAVENEIGSRNIEDMHGLYRRQPGLASALLIGIAGMFLAPFGMLIAKWEAFTSFISAGGVSMLLVATVAFGSATTMVYWTQWLVKLLSIPAGTERQKNHTPRSVRLSLIVHVMMMLALCATYPLFSEYFIAPMLRDIGFVGAHQLLSLADRVVMILMLAAIFVIPALGWLISRKAHFSKSMLYMSGINQGDHRHFSDSFGQPKKMYFANWYLTDVFGEKKLLKPAAIAAIACILFSLGVALGGAF